MTAIAMPMDALNQALQRIFGDFVGESPRWRYFTPDGAAKRYCAWKCGWTTERENNGKFASFVYERHGTTWTLTRKCLHATRRKAKARAQRLANHRTTAIQKALLQPVMEASR